MRSERRGCESVASFRQVRSANDSLAGSSLPSWQQVPRTGNRDPGWMVTLAAQSGHLAGGEEMLVARVGLDVSQGGIAFRDAGIACRVSWHCCRGGGNARRGGGIACQMRWKRYSGDLASCFASLGHCVASVEMCAASAGHRSISRELCTASLELCTASSGRAGGSQ